MTKRSSTIFEQEILADDPLREFFVWWDDVPNKETRKFKKCLSTAKKEEELQSFLTLNPVWFALQLGGGHGRWVIPKQRLGSEHVTDFMIAEKSSIGFEWYAVELESPTAMMFTKAGNPTQALTHAIRQIQDWRSWLRLNQNYAARAKDKGGLGLTDVSADLPGLVLIGRRDEVDESTNERRRQMINDLRIDIHTYDWLAASRGGLFWEHVVSKRKH
jgi:hypothetical protein